MVLDTNNEDGSHQIQSDEQIQDHDGCASAPRLTEYRVRIPSLTERLLHEQNRTPRLLDFLRASPSMPWFKKLKFPSPLKIFRRKVGGGGEEISISVPSPAAGERRRFHIHFIRSIDWSALRAMCKDWIKNPMNIALLLWLLCVGVSGAMLILLLLGLLDRAFPTTALRNHWIEINNQVLNALFTLMSIYQHPSLCHHLFLLCRWRPEDAGELRAAYCKDASPRPGERKHMTAVVLLLHFTVVCQYILCGLYWGYTKKQRPELVENLFFVSGVVAPVVAVVYTVCSPLGKECSSDSDEGSQSDGGVSRCDVCTRRRLVVSEPEWVGGMFDCGDDVMAGCLSCFCTFCVFGWNMERLGFGNMYVHIVTFVLLCVAPLWIFSISALNIHNYVIGDIVGVAGILLCVFGLLYGGYWRIQMRKKFKLPGSRLCCGSKSLMDYARWLFCWPCALAQEVRTANFYDVEDESFYRKLAGEGEERQPLLASEDGDSGGPEMAVASDSPRLTVAKEVKESSHLVVVHDEMIPPVQLLIRVEDGGDECNLVHAENISPVLISVRTKDSLVEDLEPNSSDLSERNWRVERVKKLINVLTLVSFLILMYTRGFIR